MTRYAPPPIPEQPRPSFLWAFVTGRPLDGIRRTNATWLRAGTRALVVNDMSPPSRLDYLPGYQRLAYRSVLNLWALGLGWSWWYARPLFVVLATSAALGLIAGAVLGAMHAHRQWLAREHRRRVVRPLHLALHPHLEGLGELDKPDRYLHVPANYAEPDGDPVVIHLPERFDGRRERKDVVETIVRAKLGLLGDVKLTWKLTGHDHHVICRRVAPPPADVLYTDPKASRLFADAGTGELVLGVGVEGRTVTVNLDTSTPHVGISAGTGAGKSVLLRVLVAQLLHRGATATIVDPKRFSLRAFADMPGVVDYLKDSHAMHHGLIAVAGEALRRAQLADDRGGDVLTDLHRHVLVIDELNTLMGALQAYWADNRPKGTRAGTPSPAITALSTILFLGREVRMHVLVASQAMTADALGGGARGSARREQFGARILGRATPQTWAYFAPAVDVPARIEHPGRMHLVVSDRVQEVQVIWMTEDEAHTYALAGDRPEHQGSGVIGARVFPMPAAGPQLRAVRSEGDR